MKSLRAESLLKPKLFSTLVVLPRNLFIILKMFYSKFNNELLFYLYKNEKLVYMFRPKTVDTV